MASQPQCEITSADYSKTKELFATCRIQIGEHAGYDTDMRKTKLKRIVAGISPISRLSQFKDGRILTLGDTD